MKKIIKAIWGSMYWQLLVCSILGIVIGLVSPEWSHKLAVLPTIFIALIKMVIPPVIFGTIVLAFIKTANAKKMGTMGIKAIIYFEVMTTIALLLGLLVVNLIHPGVGMNIDPNALSMDGLEKYSGGEKFNFIKEIIPTTFISAFVDGKMLQVILVAILFGIALQQVGSQTPSTESKKLGAASGKGVSSSEEGYTDEVQRQTAIKVQYGIELLTAVFFKIVNMVIRLVPLSALGALAQAVSSFGVESLLNMLALLGCLLLSSVIFVCVFVAAVFRYSGVSLWKFLVYIKDELFVSLATSSSESILPQYMAKLKKMGVGEEVVSLIVPLGYSFNLDGSCLYLTMAAMFISQAMNIPMTISEQLFICLLLMIISKGVAAVAGGGFVTLASTLQSYPKLPISGLSLLLGIDFFMSEIRTVTNIIGNGCAAIFIAKIEGLLDIDDELKIGSSKSSTKKPAKKSAK